MGRHVLPQKNKSSNLNQAREDVLRSFFELEEKTRKHLVESLMATRICSFCDASGKAPKLDNEKKCLLCHGTDLIPDVARRNWAFEEIQSRVLPKPKAVEMQVDTNDELENMTNVLSSKSTTELENLVKQFPPLLVKNE